jgi:hypothetical protein
MKNAKRSIASSNSPAIRQPELPPLPPAIALVEKLIRSLASTLEPIVVFLPNPASVNHVLYVVRGVERRINPILACGFMPPEMFLESPGGFLFKRYPAHYSYLRAPVNLHELLKVIPRLKSLADSNAAATQWCLYGNTEAIIYRVIEHEWRDKMKPFSVTRPTASELRALLYPSVLYLSTLPLASSSSKSERRVVDMAAQLIQSWDDQQAWDLYTEISCK